MKLWELSKDIEDLATAIEQLENDTSISENEREDLLSQLYQHWLESDENFENKAINTASFIRYLEAITNARKEEIKRLQTLAKQSENQANNLKKYLTEHMKRTGKTKIEGTTAKLSLRKKPSQMVISCDVEDLPEQFQKVSIEPDKTKLKQWIKENGDLTHVKMIDSNEYSLIIK